MTPEQPASVDDRIDAWHESGDEETRPLHEYLGWTWEEYKAWVVRGIVPEREARRV